MIKDFGTTCLAGKSFKGPALLLPGNPSSVSVLEVGSLALLTPCPARGLCDDGCWVPGPVRLAKGIVGTPGFLHSSAPGPWVLILQLAKEGLLPSLPFSSFFTWLHRVSFLIHFFALPTRVSGFSFSQQPLQVRKKRSFSIKTDGKINPLCRCCLYRWRIWGDEASRAPVIADVSQDCFLISRRLLFLPPHP